MGGGQVKKCNSRERRQACHCRLVTHACTHNYMHTHTCSTQKNTAIYYIDPTHKIREHKTHIPNVHTYTYKYAKKQMYVHTKQIVCDLKAYTHQHIYART